MVTILADSAIVNLSKVGHQFEQVCALSVGEYLYNEFWSLIMLKTVSRVMNPALSFMLMLLCYFFSAKSLAQGLVINEVMSSNVQTILDEDGDTPDWIEIYNSGPDPIDLTGYSLVDSSTIDTPWIFPDMSIMSGAHLLLFASDKDRNEVPLRWETVIDLGDNWNYIVPNQELPTNWNSIDFDDSTWDTGISGFGYGDNDDSTIVSNVMSVFIRTTFEVETPEDIEEVLLHMDYDDAFVAYINGTEIARANITSEGPPPFDQPADNYDHEAQMYQGNPPDVFAISELEDVLLMGTNVLAIQVHNHSTGSSDLTAIPFLSLGSSNPDALNSLSEFLTTGTKNLHLNFKIASDGEFLILKDANGELVDSLYSRDLPGDISLGRSPDGTGDWLYFDEPTPGGANIDQGFNDFAGEVTFSEEAGHYQSTISLQLSSPESNDQIFFSTDGSLPAESGIAYTGSINISSTTVIRAQVINPGSLPGPINSRSFFINTDHDLPIISLVTHPGNFWDYNEGIYVMGPNASPNIPHDGANFWQDWEKPVHVEMFETDGDLAISQDAGTKIFGGWSRANAQKSLSIFARKSYGNDDFDHALFGSRGLDKFANFVLRNSGNDWNNTMFRDAFNTTLFHENVDVQDYRPAVIYINGEYWGIQNIREKVNEDYLGNHYDLDPDEITILELNAEPVEGDEQEYADLINFVNTNDLAVASNYQYVIDRIDVFNYTQYLIGNIFIDNKDWPGNNIKYWKSNQPNSKWKWIAFDTDFGFDPWNEGNVNYNTLQFALEPNGPGWPNPSWSTLLFRKLIENESFKINFINSFADRLNTELQSDILLGRLDEFESGIESEIASHLSRWGGNFADFEYNVSRMRNFAEQRPSSVKQHLKSEFGLSDDWEVTLNVNDEAYGEIRVNTLVLERYPWSGEYFQGIPIELEAIPKPGYQFLRWEGGITQTNSTIEINLQNDTNITAVFEESDSELNSIVINEINYNSPDDFETEDWVELYNKGSETIDLSGWVLKDDNDDHSFVFPEGTSLSSDQYLVVCRDQEVFDSMIGDVRTVGNMDFGLSGDGDCVRLFTSEQILSDEVCYLPESPWPTLPDGNGGTLALKEPGLDNADPYSWYGRANNGNPGESNRIDLTVLDVSAPDIGFQIFPNPTMGVINLKFKLDRSGDVQVNLFDLSGKRLKQCFYKNQSAGQINHQFDFDGISPGLYLFVLETSSFKKSVRIQFE